MQKAPQAPNVTLWIVLGVIFVWSVAFLRVAAGEPDLNGDGKFSISDIPYVAREASVGWVEREAAKYPCEEVTAADRFWESSECERFLSLKWWLAAFSFAVGGILVGWLGAVAQGIWWRISGQG